MYWNQVVEEPKKVGRRLIETWDVLKSHPFTISKSCIYRLIETWDVLKY